jgi:hypothetical protein
MQQRFNAGRLYEYILIIVAGPPTPPATTFRPSFSKVEGLACNTMKYCHRDILSIVVFFVNPKF